MSSASRKQELDLMFRGYETLGEKLQMTDSLHDVCRVLVGVEEPVFCDGYSVLVDDVVEMTRNAMNKYYKLHDVDYCGVYDLEYIFNEIKDLLAGYSDDPEFRKLFRLINFAVEKRSPFEMPVALDFFDNPFNGELIDSIVGAPSMDYADKSRIVFSGVTLDRCLSNMSGAIYAHEITHSQVDSVKGSCCNYQNMEVLSIFNEKLVAMELDPSLELLKKMEKSRAFSLVNSFRVLNYQDEFDEETVLKASTYVISTLQANHLFDKYLNGSEDERNAIILGVQRVFDGESTVEDLLSNNNVSFENSCDVELFKRHI